MLNAMYEQFLSTSGIKQLSENKMYSKELDVTMELTCEEMPIINKKRIVSITFTYGYNA